MECAQTGLEGRPGALMAHHAAAMCAAGVQLHVWDLMHLQAGG
jgi:hypothetical protein